MTVDNIRADNRGARPILSVDLRHVRDLDRLLVIVAPMGAPWQLTGALTVRTPGGTRIERAVELPPSAGVSVVLSAYQVDGELVLRGERDPVGGTLRDACLAYGYDDLTWIDPYTPAE